MSSCTTERRSFASAVALGLAAPLALAGALTLSLALAGCSRSSDEGKRPATTTVAKPEALEPLASAGPEAGDEPPSSPKPPGALEVITGDDLVVSVKHSGKKGTLISAWASFCPPCKREIPMLEGLATNLKPKGLDFVLVSLDEPDDHEKAEAFLHEHGVGLKSFIAARPLGPFKQAMNPRWPGMLPASFLFDATGTLRYFWGGEAFEDEVLPVLEAFLAGKPMDGEATPAVAPETATQ